MATLKHLLRMCFREEYLLSVLQRSLKAKTTQWKQTPFMFSYQRSQDKGQMMEQGAPVSSWTTAHYI